MHRPLVECAQLGLCPPCPVFSCKAASAPIREIDPESAHTSQAACTASNSVDVRARAERRCFIPAGKARASGAAGYIHH